MLESEYTIRIVLAVAASVLTFVITFFRQRRGRFRYTVTHHPIGVSGDDVAHGSVRILHNDRPVANLFLSTVELTNQSLRDYDDVTIVAYSSDTQLLTERVELVGTTSIINWTPEFADQLRVSEGGRWSDDQIELALCRREFFVPTLNRGQAVRFQFLNSAVPQKQPYIWLDCVHKGVRIEYRGLQALVFGVPQPQAALAGIVIGLALLAAVVAFVPIELVPAFVALVYGFVAQVPGAFAVKGWRWIRDTVAG